MAVVALGGHPVSVQGSEVGIGSRETPEDVARTLACYHRVLALRVIDHSTLVRMALALDAAGVPVPVVNLLSDQAHPCQALADRLTLEDALAPGCGPEGLAGRSLAYVGDANNVCRSLAKVALAAGMAVAVASPAGYGMDPAEQAALGRWAEAAGRGGRLRLTEDPVDAVEGAEAVYTDVWASMGQEGEAEARRAAFAGFGVDEALMARAAPGAVFLHCLPAHRGEEVSPGVLEGPASWVWPQAAHRMTAMRGLLRWLVGEGSAR
jgi:ornithine carbamoyltransferase